MAIDHLFSVPVFLSALGENHDLGTAAYLQSRVDGLQQPVRSHPARTHTPPAALCKGTGRKVNTWLPSQHFARLSQSILCHGKGKNPLELDRQKKELCVFLPRINFLQPAAEINLSKAQGQGTSICIMLMVLKALQN